MASVTKEEEVKKEEGVKKQEEEEGKTSFAVFFQKMLEEEEKEDRRLERRIERRKRNLEARMQNERSKRCEIERRCSGSCVSGECMSAERGLHPQVPPPAAISVHAPLSFLGQSPLPPWPGFSVLAEAWR